MLRVTDRVQELSDLLLAQHVGKFPRLPTGRDVLLRGPGTLERDGVEEPQGRHRDDDRTGGEVPLIEYPSGQHRLGPLDLTP